VVSPVGPDWPPDTPFEGERHGAIFAGRSSREHPRKGNGTDGDWPRRHGRRVIFYVTQTQSVRSRRSSRRHLDPTEVAGIGLIVGLLAAAAVTLVVFSSVPLRFDLVLRAGGPSAPGAQNLTFPGDDQIQGSWSASGDNLIKFTVSTEGGEVVYSSTGLQGSFLFHSALRQYEFAAVPMSLGPVTTWVNGTYTAPFP